MKKAKLKKEKAYSQCAVIGSLPDIKCGDGKNLNRLTKVKFNTETKEVFDEWDNKIGIGEMKDGRLLVTQEVRANYL